MGFISEFKEFAMKGNVLDMAVGVIIGGAFGKIVSSLVDDVLMPLVGMITGNIDFWRGRGSRCTEVWHLHPEHGRLCHCCILYLPHAESHQQDEPQEGRA